MILDDIVAAKKKKLAEVRQKIPLGQLKINIKNQPQANDFAASLRSNGIRLIAEVKRSSPSAGLIRAEFNPVEIAQTYADSGAAAISVLTEETYFNGSLSYLESIRKALGNRRLPLLRKDFIFDPYQVYESRACGADAILLIAAILTQNKLKALLSLSRDLGMEALVEVHNEDEVSLVLKSDARVIGINNRNLKSFETDIATTERLRILIPKDRIIVSESGIKTVKDIARLKHLGVDAVLIGEALMASSDIATKIKEIFAPDEGQ